MAQSHSNPRKASSPAENEAAKKMARHMATDKQIKQLRDAAAEASDIVQVHACDVALGREELITDGEAFDERYGGGGWSRDEADAIMAIETVEQAREMCVAALADARAQER